MQNDRIPSKDGNMKLAFYDSFRLGVVRGDNVFDVHDAAAEIPRVGPQDLLRALIEGWGDWREALERAADNASPIPLANVRLRPPVPRPANIDCMAVNYMEGRTEAPPLGVFLKSPNSIVGPGDKMILPDAPAGIFEGEAELGVIIGRRAFNVSASEAMGYVFGYTNVIDGSARPMVMGGNVFYAMKSRETFCPVGPVIVTADEIPDPSNLAVRQWTNGVLMQDFNTSDMAHDIASCIEYVSSVHTVEPGDLLATGTTHSGLNPFMDGDEIEVEVEGLGRLAITVSDPLQRTWKRETRANRQEGELYTPQVSGKYAPS
jgi:2-keto-4-pentenoate hydratase/2-oxohepta-3-ene-1,7-dioic acid hydratase in catechol pathway